MGLVEKFLQFIKKEKLFLPKDKLLIAVSGGIDSVVLCELCKQAGLYFVIAHCNFGLRGAESDRDEVFVKELGEKYGADVLVKKFDTTLYANSNKLGIQAAARELRYNWFNELLTLPTAHCPPPTSNCPLPTAHYILTAHHANDNIETLLMNFFKGTGIVGMKGILPKQGKLIRPLLFAKKEELVHFAKAQKLPFVEDSSNVSDKYTRNYFRNQLIPDLQKVFPQAEDNLLHNLPRFREIELLYHQAIAGHKGKLVEKKGNEYHIPALKLKKTIPLLTVCYEIIKDFGFTPHQAADAISLLDSESGKYISSATHRIIKNRSWLIIAPIDNVESLHILIEEKESIVNYDQGMIQLKKLPSQKGNIPVTNEIATLDATKLKFPLLLRKRQPGDYFYPLGMQKKKKISRFLTDQKLSLFQKEKIWVIESAKKIIWVIGLRIDNRFKVTESTKEIIQISALKSGDG